MTDKTQADYDIPSDLKRNFVIACRILACEGVSEAAFNVSCRINDNVWMTMPVTSPTLVEEDELVIGKIADGSANWKAHPAIYEARPDVGAIVHCHPIHVVALSTLEQSFSPVHHYGAPFHGKISTFKSPGQTKSELRAGEIARQLGQNRCILQRGHGVIVVGKDLQEAVLLTLFLEESVKMNLIASQLGNPEYLTIEQSEKIVPQILKQRSLDKAWNHYKNKARILGYL